MISLIYLLCHGKVKCSQSSGGNVRILCLFNSLHASGHFCPLLITFANSLDPYQARQNVGPDLDPDCLTLMVFLKLFFFFLFFFFFFFLKKLI